MIKILIKIIILNIIACVLVGCINEDKYFFNGDIRFIDSSRKIVKNVTSKTIALNGIQSGMIAVYDSLLICWHPDLPNHFFYIINLDTGKEEGFFCEKGQGPKETISVNCIFHLFQMEKDICTYLWSYNENRLLLWNISQSIKCRTTIYDTIITYEKNRYFFLFYQPENMIYVNRPSDILTREEASTPYYEKRSISTKEVIQKYPIYKKTSLQSRDAGNLEPLFYTWDIINTDGSKIAQVMRHFPQINILNTKTGEIVGYRINNKVDFSLFKLNKDPRDLYRYYNCVQADDNFIYATYWGKETSSGRIGDPTPFLNTIHVFDWNGNMLYELITDRPFFRSIWLDKVRNRLYTMDVNTDEVYYLDLGQLNLIK